MVPGSITTDTTNSKKNSVGGMTIYRVKMGVQLPSEMSWTSNPYLHQALDNVENNYITKSKRAWADYFQHLKMGPTYKAYAYTH